MKDGANPAAHAERARGQLAALDAWERDSHGSSSTECLLRCIAESALGLLELALEDRDARLDHVTGAKGDQMTSPQDTRKLLQEAVFAINRIEPVLGKKAAAAIRDEIYSAGEDYFEEGGGD